MCGDVAPPHHLPAWHSASWSTGTTLPSPIMFKTGSFFYCWTTCHTADSTVAKKWLPVFPMQNNLFHSTVEESKVLTVYCTGFGYSVDKLFSHTTNIMFCSSLATVLSAYITVPHKDYSHSSKLWRQENFNSKYYKHIIKILFQTTFLYSIEESLFLLFCNGKTTYLNPSWPAGGVYSTTSRIFDLQTGVQNVSWSYAGKCMYTVPLNMLIHKIYITVVL